MCSVACCTLKGKRDTITKPLNIVRVYENKKTQREEKSSPLWPYKISMEPPDMRALATEPLMKQNGILCVLLRPSSATNEDGKRGQR